MNVYMSPEELEALKPCSPEAFRLYVACLRPHMDMATGIVGISYRISYARLALEMVYQPPARSHRPPYAPTVKQIRGLVDELATHGAVKRYSMKSKDDRQLVLLLINALQVQARPEYEGQMKGKAAGQADGQSQTRANARSKGHEGQADGQRQSGYEGQISVSLSTTSLSGARGTLIDPAFQADLSARLLAEQRGLDVDEEVFRFIAHFEANGQPQANWPARFRKWILDAAQYNANRKAKNAAAPPYAGKPARGGWKGVNPTDVFDRIFDDGGQGDGGDYIDGSAERVDQAYRH
ncbi:hypothetical protein [Amantichitinum ursilacus]|uniref:DnaT DNA-binding domain-containing protein n=1 Tax=Amantichitinum ursilacus TaxID=857265 RepID=A0A0N0XKP5_9NEIS|nr:hypothetical protein [Amantichitinum ursilacus]KPC53011.1 hypothetical protein WG78_10990 [Amantichitinum ursilacus]